MALVETGGLIEAVKALNPPDYCFLWWQAACMPRTDWAAWLQAVGSIVAIFASVRLVGYQHSLESRRNEEAERRAIALPAKDALKLMRVALSFSIGARHDMVSIEQAKAYFDSVAPMASFGRLRAALDRFELENLRPVSLAIAFEAGRDAVKVAVSTLEHARPHLPGVNWPQMKETLDRATAEIDQSVKQFQFELDDPKGFFR